MSQLLGKLREYLLKNLGLNFTVGREMELYDRMKEASESFNFNDTDKFIEWLIDNTLDTNQTKRLASFLTIGETYFLREKNALDYLEFEYLPRILHQRKGNQQSLKIWSAGCSSGEEAYSIAIMLKRLIPSIGDWDITIKATDINPNFIEKAKKGEYTEWSFRGVTDSFKGRYFKKTDNGKYLINKDIKEMVDFSFLNLISDGCHYHNKNSFDIILCRNVMIYFSCEGIQSVTTKFYNSLGNGGILVLSPVESTNLICNKFKRYFKDGATIYKKADELIDNVPFAKSNCAKKYKLKQTFSFNSYKKEKSQAISHSKNNINHTKNRGIQKSNFYCSEKKDCIDLQYGKLLDQYKSGLHDKVEETLTSIINEVDDYRYCLLLAKIKINKKQLVNAENLCLKAIEINKIDAEGYYLLANIFFEQRKEQEAIEFLNKSLFLDPNYTLSHYLLGNIYKVMGNNEESRRSFNNAKESLKFKNPNTFISDYDDITVDKFDKAINSYLV